MMRIFSLLLPFARSVGCGGTVVAQQAETQPLAPAKEQTPAAVTGGQAKEVVNSIGIKLLLMSAGTFTMGSPASEKYRDDDETQHQVTLSKPFYMGRTEVTQGQWKKVMGTEPWKGEDYVQEGDDCPAVYISWDDAVAFCKKLSDMEGKTYRLPTEAEWEYACRGGTNTAFSFGDDDSQCKEYAWFYGNAYHFDEHYSHQVAQKRPNAFGLYDMHGNVWEWCSDWYGEYPPGLLTDPRGPDTGSSKVLRGGSAYSVPRGIRCARRNLGDPEILVSYRGFRLVLE
jgi:formylglycine-generating enzyme required for sulfatase activity